MKNRHFALALLVLSVSIGSFGFSHKASQRTILYIGDSQTVGSLSFELTPLLRKEIDASVWTYGVWGSAPWDWLRGWTLPARTLVDSPETSGPDLDEGEVSVPTFRNLLNQVKPDAVLIQQGGNMMPASDELIESNMKEMIAMVHRTKSMCFWVGPSNGRKRDPMRMLSIYKLMERVTAENGCTLIDSRSITRYPAEGGDGIHFYSLGAEGRVISEEWARGILTVMQKKM